MSVWNTSTPAGSDLLSQGDDRIREMKNAIQDALRGDDAEGVEAIFPGASPSTAPVYRYRGLKGSTVERPTSGQYGLFFDTTRNVLQRDNGTSWDDVGALIPAGTKMVFYQASAPVGWTAVALNDKFLRVVTAGGTGGSTGGTVAASTSLTHTHTTGDHAISESEMPSHRHRIRAIAGVTSGYTTREFSESQNLGVDGASGTNGTTSVVDTLGSGLVVIENTGGGATHNHGATGNGLSGASFVYAYADIIVCSKD